MVHSPLSETLKVLNYVNYDMRVSILAFNFISMALVIYTCFRKYELCQNFIILKMPGMCIVLNLMAIAQQSRKISFTKSHHTEIVSVDA